MQPFCMCSNVRKGPFFANKCLKKYKKLTFKFAPPCEKSWLGPYIRHNAPWLGCAYI